jgi:hypothetical protein
MNLSYTNRHAQSAMATIPVKTTAKVANTKHPRPGIVPDANPKHNTITADEAMIANIVPATFACKLIHNCPRTK